MDKKEAIHALIDGEKVSHELFEGDEFIYMKDGEIHDEKGYNIDAEFWKWRQGEVWDKGYRIYEIK